jgi:NADH-quinone oxidoreductase subunit A
MFLTQLTLIVLLALSMGLLLLALSALIQRITGIYNPGGVKNEVYECGMKPLMDSFVQFDIKYYLFAIIFIIFDVEFVFLMPWANLYNSVPAGQRALLIFEAFMFVFILLLALLYAWKKGALKWKQ